MKTVGGNIENLRPHVKTHKMSEVMQLQLDAGITRCKCATIAEMEMAAEAGVPDILMAYQPIGPNISRLLELSMRYPETTFSALVDDPNIVDTISRTFEKAGRSLRLLVDVDCGMHRTGIETGDDAFALCQRVVDSPAVMFTGLHVYDGHNQIQPIDERKTKFNECLKPVEAFVKRLVHAGISVGTIVGGGSPTFGLHAREAETGSAADISYQCSPGTTLFWDAGTQTSFTDLPFSTAAMLLTRVLSRPSSGRLCFDLGHKAVAAENPINKRVRFPDLPDANPVLQSEEHLVVETSKAADVNVGDLFYGIPWHICPTVALHQEALIIRDGRFSGERWAINARNRRILI